MAGFESIGESSRYEVSGRMVRFAVASALKDGVSDEEAVSELLGRWQVRAVGGFADADGAFPDDVRKCPRPCPFCGGEKIDVEDMGEKPASADHGGAHWWSVCCDSCGANVYGWGEEGAWAKWNMRAS